jgi:hypothetical protein
MRVIGLPLSGEAEVEEGLSLAPRANSVSTTLHGVDTNAEVGELGAGVVVEKVHGKGLGVCMLALLGVEVDSNTSIIDALLEISTSMTKILMMNPKPL